MTTEQLLKMSASQLEALSDAELEVILGPHIAHTRPENARKADSPKKFVSATHNVQRKAQDLLALFEKKHGLK
jgi:hypothetical protein